MGEAACFRTAFSVRMRGAMSALVWVIWAADGVVKVYKIAACGGGQD